MKYLDYAGLFDTEPADLALLSTFNFEPDFFERRLLRTEALSKARRIMVMMDAGQWRKLVVDDVPARWLNRRYFVVPVRRASGVFHPKLNLMIGPSTVSLHCGSANLTRSGCTSNLELANAASFPLVGDTSLGQAGHALAAAAFGFFERAVADAPDQSGRLAAEWLGEVKLLYPWLRPGGIGHPQNGLRLLHTYDGSLWDQVRRLIGTFSPTRVMLISPYYDSAGEIIRRVGAEWPRCKIEVIVQQGTTTLPVASIKSQRLSVSLFAVTSSARRLHSKLLVLEGRDARYCLVGSANMTTSAMDGRNVETCLFFRDDENATDALFDGQLGLRPVALDDFDPGSDTEPEPLGVDDGMIVLREAVLGSGDKLTFSYVCRTADRPTALALSLRAGNEPRPRASISVPPRAEGSATVTLPNAAMADMHGTMLATLVADTPAGRVESAPVFIVQADRLTHESSGSSAGNKQQVVEESGVGLPEYLEELGGAQGAAAVVEYLRHLNIRFFDGSGGLNVSRDFSLRRHDPFHPDVRPDWMLNPDIAQDDLRGAILDFVDRHEKKRLQRHADRGNINGMENFLDILSAMVRLLYVYHRRGVVERGHLIGRVCRYVAVATRPIDESEDYFEGYLSSLTANLAGEKNLLREVCREFNFAGKVWATLLVGQVARFDPTEVPLWGNKAKQPSDCLPQQSRIVGEELHRAALSPTGQQLADALAGLNMVPESELATWVAQAHLPPNSP
jgi:hypothetical protein